MVANVRRLLVLLMSLGYVAGATIDTRLIGTWTSKSRQVVTGRGFYDPVADELKEPPLTGISYSFSDDGHYEEAYYRAVSDPSKPECASGIMQWQHGTYSVQPDGSLVLTPIAEDGRQLQSNPCDGHIAKYSRYNQTETFKSYRVHIDKFHNVLRLDLVHFDGAPMQPLYILYQPPEMLPTTKLNAGNKKSPKKAKRDMLVDDMISTNGPLIQIESAILNARYWWWFGAVMTSLGGLVLLCS